MDPDAITPAPVQIVVAERRAAGRPLAVALVLVLVLVLVGGLIWVGAVVLGPHRLPALQPTRVELAAMVQNTRRTAAVASDGAVWLAESGRLSRIDPSGARQNWDIGDDPAFDAWPVAARAGGVWLVHGSSIRRFDGRTLGPSVEGPTGATIETLAEALDGTIWIGTSVGLYRRDGTGWIPVATPNGLRIGAAMTFDRQGSFWIAFVSTDTSFWGHDQRVVARLEGSTWTTFTDSSIVPLLSSGAASIAAAPDGSVWFGSDGGLSRYRDGAWHAYPSGDLGIGPGDEVASGPDGTIWAYQDFSTDPCCLASSLKPDGTWRVYGVPDDLQGGVPPFTLLATRSGADLATFGLDPAQLYRLDGSAWTILGSEASRFAMMPDAVAQVGGVPGAPYVTTYATAPSLTGGDAGDVWAIDSPQDSTPQLWHVEASGISGNGLGLDGELASALVHDVAVGPDGTVWAATDQGVAKLRYGRWTVINDAPASVIALGQDGRVWASGGDRRLGFLEEHDGVWVPSSVPDLPLVGAYKVRTMLVDAVGDPWVVAGVPSDYTVPELWRLEGSTWQRVIPVRRPDGTQPAISDLAVASDGNVWVTIGGLGTEHACCDPADPSALVARFDGRDWTTYGVADGIVITGAGPRGIAITPDGSVWLAGGGLDRFDGVSWTPYQTGHGIDGVAASGDGSLWTVGSSGLLHITLGPPPQGR